MSTAASTPELRSIALRFTPRLIDSLRADPAFRRHSNRPVVLALDLALLLASLWFLFHELNQPESWASIVLWSGAALIFVGELSRRSLLFLAITALRFRTEPRLRSPFDLRVSSEGLHYSQADWQASMAWSYFEWFLETPDAFILAYPKKRYSVVPKWAFPSESELTQFRNLVARALPACGRYGSAA